MSGEIFEQQNVTLKAKSGLMSFEGCPNQCRDGYYVDPYQHKRIRCEHCFELRKKLVQEQAQLSDGGRVAEILNLPVGLLGYGSFDANTVWRDVQRKKLEPWSVEFVSQVLSKLVERVSVGEPVGSSILINPGERADVNGFMYTFLMRSYISGLTTAPFLRVHDICKLRYMELNPEKAEKSTEYGGFRFEDVLKADTCLVYVDAGAFGRDTLGSVRDANGLMQLRALNGKSTVIVTGGYDKYELFTMADRDFHDARVLEASTNTIAQSVSVVSELIDGSIAPVRSSAVYVGVRYKRGKTDGQEEPEAQGVGHSQVQMPNFPQRTSELTPEQAKLMRMSQGNIGVG